MLNISAEIWNRIAKHGLKTGFGKRFLNLGQEKMSVAHGKEIDRLKNRGVDPKVALAYMKVAPHLVEREAIGKECSEDPELRLLMPEILTTDEAVQIAIREYALDADGVNALARLLNRSNKST